MKNYSEFLKTFVNINNFMYNNYFRTLDEKITQGFNAQNSKLAEENMLLKERNKQLEEQNKTLQGVIIKTFSNIAESMAKVAADITSLMSAPQTNETLMQPLDGLPLSSVEEYHWLEADAEERNKIVSIFVYN